MGISSKYFHEAIGNAKCYEFIHVNQSCGEFCLLDLRESLIGSLKHNVVTFLVIFFMNVNYFTLNLFINNYLQLPLLFKPGSINRTMLLNLTKDYLSGTICCTIISAGIKTSICINSNCFGKFNYWTYLTVPTFICCLSYHFGPQKGIQIYTTSMTQLVINNYIFLGI